MTTTKPPIERAMLSLIIEDPLNLLGAINRVVEVLNDGGFGQISYGFFYGGDPNHFQPDPDAATPEEYAQWQADCAAFAKGEQEPTPPSCAPNTEPFTYTTKKGETRTVPPGAAVLTRSFYGLGTNFNTDDAAILVRLLTLQQILKRHEERMLQRSANEEGD